MKANFQTLFKPHYRILFSCFYYIPLSIEYTVLKHCYNTRKIIFLGLLKLDYYCFCFLSFLSKWSKYGTFDIETA